MIVDEQGVRGAARKPDQSEGYTLLIRGSSLTEAELHRHVTVRKTLRN